MSLNEYTKKLKSFLDDAQLSYKSTKAKRAVNAFQRSKASLGNAQISYKVTKKKLQNIFTGPMILRRCLAQKCASTNNCSMMNDRRLLDGNKFGVKQSGLYTVKMFIGKNDLRLDLPFFLKTR